MLSNPDQAPEEVKEEPKKPDSQRTKKITNQQLWEALEKLNAQLTELKLIVPKNNPVESVANAEEFRKLNDQLRIIKIQMRSLSDQMSSIESKLNIAGNKGETASRKEYPSRVSTAAEPAKNAGDDSKAAEQESKKKWWKISKK
jgi:predicted  nucleic acid-binding Zn-ribbon protein